MRDEADFDADHILMLRIKRLAQERPHRADEAVGHQHPGEGSDQCAADKVPQNFRGFCN